MARRRKSGRVLLWVIVAIMVVAMAGFGLNTAMQTTPSSPVFRVGESEISQEDYFNALQSRISEISQSQGQPFSMAEARLVGIPEQVRARLVNQATLSEIARRNNLIASDEAVGKALLEIEAFQDAQGNFSRQNLDLFLRNRGLSENEFLNNVRDDLERSQVLDILSGQPLEMDHLSGLLVDQFGERRVISFVDLANFGQDGISDPTEEEMRGRYDEDPSRYLGKPIRSYELAYILPDESKVDDTDMAQYYDEHQAEFGTPAKVDYKVLSFPSEDEAQAFYDAPDFASVAEERGLEVSDYEVSERELSAMPEDFQSAVDANGVALYPPQKTLLGWNVYEVTRLVEADVSPLEEVKDEIRAKLALENLNTQLTNQYEAINTLIADGADPKTIAEQSDLEFVTWSNDQVEILGLSDQAAFSEYAEQAEINTSSELVKLDNGGVFVAKLIQDEPAQPKPFEAVKPQISEELKLEKLRDFQEDFAQRQINAGDSLEDIASTNGLNLTTNEAVTSQQSHNSVPLAISFDAFEKPQGEIWLARDDERYYLARIDEILPVDPSSEQGQSIAASVQAQIDGSTTQGMIVHLLQASADEFGAVQYDALIDQVEQQIR